MLTETKGRDTPTRQLSFLKEASLPALVHHDDDLFPWT